MTETQTFADFGINPKIAASLEAAGIIHPFPIQSMTLPVALSGHDIIGQAKTGTGKTLGFGVPLLHQVTGPDEDGFEDLELPGAPQALIVVPTRELAVQVTGDLKTASTQRSVRVEAVYGGRAYEPQVAAMKRGTEVVVGTPGRLIDLSQRGDLNLRHVKSVVLDEADEMLDLGFLPDVERILAMTPTGRQTMLFSATMPGAVISLARRYMTQPTHIRAMSDDGETDRQMVAAIEQFVYRAHAMDKVEMLARILQAKDRGLTIIFSRTKRTAAKVSDDLASRGFAAAAIHGDLGQGAREQALRAFRGGKVDILVATDVAARGIDVENVTHVINYQCPEDEKTYVHRVGRTGRAGNTGTAVTFVDWDDLHRWAMINKALDLGMPEPVETYSSSDNLFSDLHIDPKVTGSLPRSARTRAGLDAEELEDLGEVGASAGKRGSSRSAGRGGNPRSGGDNRHKPRSESSEPRQRSGERAGAPGGSNADGAPRRRRRTRNGNTAGGAPQA
ncbi:DEAD/DEAH box helicase [Calidifontibacter terrae]